MWYCIFRADVYQILAEHDEDKVVRRLDRISAWMQQANFLNQYGVVLTPALISYLAISDDLENLLSELGRY